MERITQEKLYKFVNELNNDMTQIEKTMNKTENALRYLELKAHYESIRISRNKFMEEFDLD